MTEFRTVLAGTGGNNVGIELVVGPHLRPHGHRRADWSDTSLRSARLDKLNKPIGRSPVPGEGIPG